MRTLIDQRLRRRLLILASMALGAIGANTSRASAQTGTIVGHVTDGERVFSYRALRIGRGDETPLPGFEQDDYVKNGGFDSRPLGDLLDELETVRRATVQLLAPLDEAAMLRRGTASGFPVSVRALAYITAGHELHHRNILKERYLT